MKIEFFREGGFILVTRSLEIDVNLFITSFGIIYLKIGSLEIIASGLLREGVDIKIVQSCPFGAEHRFLNLYLIGLETYENGLVEQ